MVQAEADVEQEVARRDFILRVEGVLIDVGGGMEAEAGSAAREIERAARRAKGVPVTSGLSACVRLKSGRGALPRVGQLGSPTALPSGSMQGSIESRIGDAKPEILKQSRLLQIKAILQIVAAV